MDFVKSVGAKVAGGAVALGVIVAAIAWWQTDVATRQAVLSGIGRALAWLGVVLVLPWAGFFLTTWVARFDSNSAGAALVAGLTALEAVGLAWLYDWSVRGALPWSLFVLGTLVAGAYNLLTCDWIAEKTA